MITVGVFQCVYSILRRNLSIVNLYCIAYTDPSPLDHHAYTMDRIKTSLRYFRTFRRGKGLGRYSRIITHRVISYEFWIHLIVGFLSHRKYNVISTVSIKMGEVRGASASNRPTPSPHSLDSGSRSHLGSCNEIQSHRSIQRALRTW